nr:DUF2274 domain-containing protein [Hephaestia sp. MAHUQ-44]
MQRLPDRTPIKLTITMLPDLSQALKEYSAFYAATYGRDEQTAELVPAMLDAFLESDRAFVRWRAANRKEAT